MLRLSGKGGGVVCPGALRRGYTCNSAASRICSTITTSKIWPAVAQGRSQSRLLSSRLDHQRQNPSQCRTSNRSMYCAVGDQLPAEVSVPLPVPHNWGTMPRVRPLGNTCWPERSVTKMSRKVAARLDPILILAPESVSASSLNLTSCSRRRGDIPSTCNRGNVFTT